MTYSLKQINLMQARRTTRLDGPHPVKCRWDKEHNMTDIKRIERNIAECNSRLANVAESESRYIAIRLTERIERLEWSLYHATKR